MSNQRAKPGRRYRLLLYERLYAMIRWPCLLIAIATFALWWYAPGVTFLASRGDWLLTVAILTGLLFLASLVARYLSFVQCFPNFVRIQTPLYRVVISYQRVTQVRPIIFKEMYPPSKQRWSQRRFLEPFFGLTAVGINLTGYPLSERWLRLWLNDYTFTRDIPGFMFLVGDWMSLSREIDGYRDRWLTKKLQDARPPRPSISPFLQQ
ncbi:MAG: hypothetical protein HY260_00335 [Chloroflexi bacterium]|nr:hypothetical protein [Chloroflexota bacterium]